MRVCTNVQFYLGKMWEPERKIVQGTDHVSRKWRGGRERGTNITPAERADDVCQRLMAILKGVFAMYNRLTE